VAFVHDPRFNRFGTIPACDRRTDRQTHDDSMASHAERVLSKMRVLVRCVRFGFGSIPISKSHLHAHILCKYTD